MDRRHLALLSPNPDINENREFAVGFIKEFGYIPHNATKEDIEWFWQDMDIDCDKETAWDYVTPNFPTLNQQYPFKVTEWFMEFYRYMPECLYYHYDKTGQIDWNLFFTLAYPLPKPLGIPFKVMISKVNVAQLRLVKEQIKDEIWNDPKLRHDVLKGELIPSIYIYYLPYWTIRKAIIERQKKHDEGVQIEKNKDLHCPSKELEKLFRHVLSLQEQGKTVNLTK